jgi:hypothetical protein
MTTLKLILINSFVLFCVTSYGQEECTFTLSKAQKLYDAGSIEQIPAMLQPCIDNGFTKDERQQAMKLIILSYLFDKNDKQADKEMLIFLNNYPEYELTASDQAEFIQLFNTYRTLPIGAIGAIATTNTAYPYAFNLRSTNPVPGGSYKNNGIGFSGGIDYTQYIQKKVDLSLEVLYVSNSYSFTSINAENKEYVNAIETQTYLQFPLTAIYKPWDFWKVSTFVRGGVDFGYLLSSTESYTNYISSNNSKPITDVNFNDIQYLNKLQYWGVFGAGFNLNIIPHSSIMLDFRYNIGLNKANGSLNSLENVLNSAIPESDFRLNNLFVSVGIFYKFYKPVKSK